MTEKNFLRWSCYPGPVRRRPGGNHRPVFVTGVPRCGSSWAGEVLGSCAGVRYVYEPLNPQWMPVVRGHLRLFRYYTDPLDVPAPVAQAGKNAFRGMQGWKQLLRAGYRGYLRAATRPAHRVVVKDPTASLMTVWIARQFAAQVLVVMRHPCGFASSVDALGWQLRTNSLLRQQALMRDHLEPYRNVLRQVRHDEWLTRGAIWASLHKVFTRQLETHDDWHLCKYEDLCNDPVNRFSTLAQEFGLRMGQQVHRKLKVLSSTPGTNPGSNRRDSGSMPGIWRQRMSPGQIDAVMGVVGDFGLDYY